jgi:hypothetical protein
MPQLSSSLQSIDTSGLSDSTTAPQTPQTVPQAQHTKCPLTLPCVPPLAAKCPHNLAYPLAHPQTLNKVRESIGNSMQAVAKCKANECVEKGTFIHIQK